MEVGNIARQKPDPASQASVANTQWFHSKSQELAEKSTSPAKVVMSTATVGHNVLTSWLLCLMNAQAALNTERQSGKAAENGLPNHCVHLALVARYRRAKATSAPPVLARIACLRDVQRCA